MSTFSTQLIRDLQDAMRSKDELKRSVIRMVRSALQNAEIAKGSSLGEQEEAEVLAREVRQRRESIEEVRKAGRTETMIRQEAELSVVLQYMPEQLSHEQVIEEARKEITEMGARGPTDRGQVMGRLMPKLRGRADGNLVNEVVTNLLTP